MSEPSRVRMIPDAEGFAARPGQSSRHTPCAVLRTTAHGVCLLLCYRPVYSAGTPDRNPSENFAFAASHAACGNGATDATSTGRRVSTCPSASATFAAPPYRKCVAFTANVLNACVPPNWLGSCGDPKLSVTSCS